MHNLEQRIAACIINLAISQMLVVTLFFFWDNYLQINLVSKSDFI